MYFGEAAVPDGECGTCPIFDLHPHSRLATEENNGEPLFRVAEKCQLGTIQLVDQAAVLTASTDCLASDTLGLRFR